MPAVEVGDRCGGQQAERVHTAGPARVDAPGGRLDVHPSDRHLSDAFDVFGGGEAGASTAEGGHQVGGAARTTGQPGDPGDDDLVDLLGAAGAELARPGRLRTTEALLPPNAKELEMTTSGPAPARPVSGMTSRPNGWATPRVLMVGGSVPRSMARVLTTASTAPAAPRVWPRIDLVELAGGTEAPNRSFTAFGSEASFAGVPVPCRLR